MKFRHYLALIAISVFLTGCGRVQPIKNVENIPVAFNLSAIDVKTTIVESGTDLGWIMSESKPGVMRGELIIRSHKAVIDVAYSDKNYSINYVDSDNLKYSEGEIHRNYNRWIGNFDVNLRKRLAVLSAKK